VVTRAAKVSRATARRARSTQPVCVRTSIATAPPRPEGPLAITVSTYGRACPGEGKISHAKRHKVGHSRRRMGAPSGLLPARLTRLARLRGAAIGGDVDEHARDPCALKLSQRVGRQVGGEVDEREPGQDLDGAKV